MQGDGIVGGSQSEIFLALFFFSFSSTFDGVPDTTLAWVRFFLLNWRKRESLRADRMRQA